MKAVCLKCNTVHDNITWRNKDMSCKNCDEPLIENSYSLIGSCILLSDFIDPVNAKYLIEEAKQNIPKNLEIKNNQTMKSKSTDSKKDITPDEKIEEKDVVLFKRHYRRHRFMSLQTYKTLIEEIRNVNPEITTVYDFLKTYIVDKEYKYSDVRKLLNNSVSISLLSLCYNSFDFPRNKQGARTPKVKKYKHKEKVTV